MNIRNRALNIYFNYFNSRKDSVMIKPLYLIAKYVDNKFIKIRLSLVNSNLSQVNPEVSIVHIAIISNCNLRCNGCSYGREYMPKKKIDIKTIKQTIDDISELNIPKIHFYGGEPLLHPDIVEMITYASKKNIFSTLGTNGVLLKKEKIDVLYLAGLRHVAIGVYGVGDDYDQYVGQTDRFEKMEANIKYIKETYPDVSISFAWLLMKPSCNLTSLHQIWDFSNKYEVPFDVSLIHYDFPYFSDGDEGALQFQDEDKEIIKTFVEELLRLKQKKPDLISTSIAGIRSIPDWLIKKEAMRIPCHRYQRLWIGANGVIRICQKANDLGNINNSRLTDLIYNETHREEAQNCFELKCSNCHVGYDQRILLHEQSRNKYSL